MTTFGLMVLMASSAEDKINTALVQQLYRCDVFEDANSLVRVG